LLRNRPDLQVVNLRGNIDTRLAKLSSNNLDAAILAVAGIERLGKKSAIQTAIKIEEMLPAGGQGSLAIQILKNQPQIFSFISPINDLESQICIKCERAFLRELGASCYTPVGVNAKIHQSQLELRTAIISYEGEEIFETFSICLPNLEEAVRLGIAAAKKTKNEANALLQKILK
jgi:hydroxymethylbilane synthase